MLRSARAVGLGAKELQQLLSERELAVLRRLAKGSLYKQIAYELAVSVSTVRSHLHNIYGKLYAGDRAQAVLMATKRGWL
jgi:DNA-binding NarL/FixJ family response regulator